MPDAMMSQQSSNSILEFPAIMARRQSECFESDTAYLQKQTSTPKCTQSMSVTKTTDFHSAPLSFNIIRQDAMISLPGHNASRRHCTYCSLEDSAHRADPSDCSYTSRTKGVRYSDSTQRDSAQRTDQIRLFCVLLPSDDHTGSETVNHSIRSRNMCEASARTITPRNVGLPTRWTKQNAPPMVLAHKHRNQAPLLDQNTRILPSIYLLFVSRQRKTQAGARRMAALSLSLWKGVSLVSWPGRTLHMPRAPMRM